MKSAKQQPKNNAARARNIRGRKHGKGKKMSGEKENGSEAETQIDQSLENDSAQTGLGKIHAKVQREIDDKPGNDIQKESAPDTGKEENKVSMKEEADSEMSMKKEDDSKVSMKEELQKKEDESSGVTMKEDTVSKTDRGVKQKANAPQYNTQYFKMENSGGGVHLLYVKDTASAYEAIRDVISNSKMYSIDGRELLSVATLFAKAKEMGREKFDTEFAPTNPVCIKLE